MGMFKLDKKQTVALTLSVLVGIIVGVVVGYVIAPIGNQSFSTWFTWGFFALGWHGAAPSACIGAFVAAALFYIRLLTTSNSGKD